VDVSRPIAAVVPTLDGPVLEVLARTTRPLSGRQVHQLAATGSEAGVRKVLGRLVDHGLVHMAEAGRTLLYTLNREHLAAPAVALLTGLRDSLIERLRAEIAGWTVAPVHASLFGSTARGDGDTGSDIDLLLIRPDGVEPDESDWQEQVATLAEHVGTWTGNHAQVYDIDEAGLRAHVHAGEAIVDEWRRDAVTLCGTDLSRLLRQLPLRGTRR
jgi:DNA-binding transcriptional ArsR family regulator